MYSDFINLSLKKKTVAFKHLVYREVHSHTILKYICLSNVYHAVKIHIMYSAIMMNVLSGVVYYLL